MKLLKNLKRLNPEKTTLTDEELIEQLEEFFSSPKNKQAEIGIYCDDLHCDEGYIFYNDSGLKVVLDHKACEFEVWCLFQHNINWTRKIPRVYVEDQDKSYYELPFILTRDNYLAWKKKLEAV